MMRQSAIGFYVKKLELEGVLASPTDGGASEAPAVVACHSHPALGGSMNDPVVSAVCAAAVRENMYALRFNFRGVGGSEGEFTGGEKERDDVRAALDVMRQWPSVSRKRIALVGYSTGATTILDGFGKLRRASAFGLIAPTLGALRSRRFARDKRPRLVIVGSEDKVAPSVDIQRVLDDCRGPVRFREIVGADHTMRGYENQVAAAVTEFLKSNL